MTIQDHCRPQSEKMNADFWFNEIRDSNQIVLHELESVSDIYPVQEIYLTIVSGKIVLQLNDQEESVYTAGNIVDIPGRTRMIIKNLSSENMAILAMRLSFEVEARELICP
jgi:hypothetical protein